MAIDFGGEPVPPEGATPRVIVDPTPKDDRAKPTEARSRWVFEPGLFVGYLSVATDRAQLSGSASAIGVSSPSAPAPGSEPSSCASVGCSYSIGSQPGAVVGPNLFAGYMLSEDFTAGLRLLAAPRVDRGGGSLVAFGPSVSLRATRSWSFGAWALLGAATVGVRTGGIIDASAPYRADQSSYVAMSASTDLGVGLGFEVALRLLEVPRGALLATSTPLFLVGSNGTAFTLPIGLAYRFQ